MKLLWKIVKRGILYPLCVIVVFFTFLFVGISLFTNPSNDRDWSPDQAMLSYADIDGNHISIHNIRNFTYASTTSYTIGYYDKTFDLSKLQKVWYIVEPFSGVPGSAHTFLSFEFEGDVFVAISIEIRKEKGESYSPIKGLFNQYELTYVIADERDVVKLRSNYRKDLVYVYPVKTTSTKAQQLFLDMIERTNKLHDHPEFYNTLTNTCTTNIVKHIDSISSQGISEFNPKVLFPANSDRLAYDLGLIDTNLSFEDMRAKYLINERAMKYADSSDFSVKIRDVR